MSKLLAFASFVATATLLISTMTPTSGIDAEFTEFKVAHGKTYANVAEETYRKSVFVMNLAKIRMHNAD